MPKDPVVPQFAVDKEDKINLIIPQTDAVLTDQGYTYNQAGVTYNQAGVTYGGITNPIADVVPMVLSAVATTPSIAIITDVYTLAPKPQPNPVMGVGWFMYVLHG